MLVRKCISSMRWMNLLLLWSLIVKYKYKYKYKIKNIKEIFTCASFGKWSRASQWTSDVPLTNRNQIPTSIISPSGLPNRPARQQIFEHSNMKTILEHSNMKTILEHSNMKTIWKHEKNKNGRSCCRQCLQNQNENQKT